VCKLVDILCIGNASYDINIPLEKFPQENTKIEISSLFEEGGGPASNAAFLLSKWGTLCSFAGLVGSDIYGRRIKQELEAVGTNLSLFEMRDGHDTPLSIIMVNKQSGSRTVINRKKQGVFLNIDFAALEEMNPKVLLFDGHEPYAALKAVDKFPDAKSVLDAGSLREGINALAENVDYLVCSERFALSYTGLSQISSEEEYNKCISELYKLNGKHVVITLGERGLVYEESGNVKTLPAYASKAVDTTGAGDIFHGAFAYGVLHNMSLLDILRLSSMTAALSVSASGARRSIPELEHVMEALNKSSG
jgi:sulfofructose kinase